MANNVPNFHFDFLNAPQQDGLDFLPEAPPTVCCCFVLLTNRLQLGYSRMVRVKVGTIDVYEEIPDTHITTSSRPSTGASICCVVFFLAVVGASFGGYYGSEASKADALTPKVWHTS